MHISVYFVACILASGYATPLPNAANNGAIASAAINDADISWSDGYPADDGHESSSTKRDINDADISWSDGYPADDGHESSSTKRDINDADISWSDGYINGDGPKSSSTKRDINDADIAWSDAYINGTDIARRDLYAAPPVNEESSQ